MKSFEERKAEVFRRSENRIKERRKARSRALTVCIPLCLIITVWSVMVLPAMLPVNNKKSGATDERAEDISGAAYSQNGYVRIETKNSATKDQTAVLKDDPTEIAGVLITLFRPANIKTKIRKDNRRPAAIHMMRHPYM